MKTANPPHGKNIAVIMIAPPGPNVFIGRDVHSRAISNDRRMKVPQDDVADCSGRDRPRPICRELIKIKVCS
jgi:hypothetical protein